MPLTDGGYSGRLFRNVRLERDLGLRHLVIGLIGDATLLGILNWKEEHDAKKSSAMQLSRHPLSYDDFISLRFVSSNPVCLSVWRVHTPIDKILQKRVLDTMNLLWTTIPVQQARFDFVSFCNSFGCGCALQVS